MQTETAEIAVFAGLVRLDRFDRRIEEQPYDEECDKGRSDQYRSAERIAFQSAIQEQDQRNRQSQSDGGQCKVRTTSRPGARHRAFDTRSAETPPRAANPMVPTLNRPA